MPFNFNVCKSYWFWVEHLEFNKTGFFPYTPATNLLFGLKEAIDMLHEEGLSNVFKRHARYAKATRMAVKAWGLEVYCQNDERFSDVLTAVLVPENKDADQLRKISGMKIYGDGQLSNERGNCMKFAQECGVLDSMTIGVNSLQQIDDNLNLFNKMSDGALTQLAAIGTMHACVVDKAPFSVSRATGITMTGYYLGALASPALFGFVVDWTGTFAYSWLGTAVLLFGAVFALSLIHISEPTRPY